MKMRQLKMTAVFVVTACLLSATAGYAGPPVWVDNFDSEALDPTWFWVNENPERWSLSEEPGFVRIYASSSFTGDENLLLRPGAEGNFAVETHVFFEPFRNFQLAGLVIYQDEANFLQLGRAYADPAACPTCVGNGIYFDQLQGGELVGSNFATHTDLQNEAYLRLELKGNRVTAFYGSDSTHWMEIGEHRLPGGFEVNAVGLTASQDFWMEDDPIPADFDYFSFSGHAKPTSPFVGAWQAVDADGGAMRLAIGGPPSGPFHITWQEGYLGYCFGEAGIGRGTGTLDPGDPYVLNGEILLECLTGANDPVMMYPTWRYDPATDTITVYGGEGETNTVWHRPGHPPPPPEWNVIARPGDDGVDGGHFPEGTVVSVLVLDDEHNTRWYGTAAAHYPEWDPDHTWVLYDLTGEGGADLMAGDHVWMYDGINAKELIVSALEVTAVDMGSLTVFGTADAGSEVFVELPSGLSTVTANQEGYWEAPFDDSALGQWWAAYQLDSDDDQTRVSFYVPATRFTVFPEWNYLEGYEWPDGAEVSITVEGKEDCSTGAIAGYPEWDPWNTFFSLDFPEDCVIEVEDSITLSFGMLNLTHVVQSLAITEVDTEANTVAGTADFDPEQYILHTWIHDIDDSYMQLTTEDGIWLADFGSLGFDLDVNMGGRVEIVDEHSNATAVDWYIPNPHFTVFPEWNYLEGYAWPDGAEVSISVEGKEDCSTGATAGYPEWDPWTTYFSLNFPDGCFVDIGDEITLEDDTTTRTHNVQYLEITSVDEVSDTVAGAAEPGAVVYAWLHEVDGSEMQLTAEDGTWLADFSSFGLEEGTCGRVEIRDEQDNATAVDWCVPNPRFTVFHDQEIVEGWDWTIGSTVQLTIDDPSTVGEPIDFITYGEVVAAPWDGVTPWLWIEFWEDFDVQPDHVVSLTDSTTTRTHTVRNLAITTVDDVADTVSGTADSDAVVYAWLHEVDGSEMQLTAVDGTWLADFSSFGLEEGTCGRVEIRDEEGNATAVDWCVPNPHFTVFPEWEWFDGYEWPDGTVSITVAGKEEDCDTDAVSLDGFFNGPFPEGCDVVVGDQVTFSDGTTNRTHTVRNLAITAVDDVADTISGTADPEAVVYAWIHEVDGSEMELVADDGTWLADFSSFGLEEGTCGRVEIRDDQRNSTAVDWCIVS